MTAFLRSGDVFVDRSLALLVVELDEDGHPICLALRGTSYHPTGDVHVWDRDEFEGGKHPTFRRLV